MALKTHTHTYTHTHTHIQWLPGCTHAPCSLAAPTLRSPLPVCRPHAPGGGGGVPPGQHAGAGQRGRRRAAAVLGRAHGAKAGERTLLTPSCKWRSSTTRGYPLRCPAHACMRSEVGHTHNLSLSRALSHRHTHTHLKTCAGPKDDQRARREGHPVRGLVPPGRALRGHRCVQALVCACCVRWCARAVCVGARMLCALVRAHAVYVGARMLRGLVRACCVSWCAHATRVGGPAVRMEGWGEEEEPCKRKEKKDYAGSESTFQSPCRSPQGNPQSHAGAQDGSIKVWDTRALRGPDFTIASLRSHTDAIIRLEWHPQAKVQGAPACAGVMCVCVCVHVSG